MVNEMQDRNVPSVAAWLGGLGLLPFVACAMIAVFSSGALKAFSVTALVGYAAVILSFLGGVHWGTAIGQGHSFNRQVPPRLIVSVLPAVLAWPLMLMPPTRACIPLAGAVIAMCCVDVYLSRWGFAPPWYPRLRIPLSCIAVASLIVGCYG
jgi:Protein of unknown function (DUF3429)